MKKTILIIITFLSYKAFCQSPSRLNQPVDNLTFSNVLNFPEPSINLADYKSKVVIIDFWATWCAPCIASFSHLESLQNTFKNDLQIITVTDDPEERIKTFLKKRPLNLPVVIDEKRKVNNYFTHRTIPHTILIDQNGIIRAITEPKFITEEVIKSVLKGEKISIPEKKDNMEFDPNEPLSNSSNILYQILVTPFQNGISTMSSPGGTVFYPGRRILATNLLPQSLYEIAYEFPVSIRTRIEVEDKSSFKWNETNRICVDIIVPEKNGKERFDIMKKLLNDIYGYKVAIENRPEKVKILKKIGNSTLGLSESKGGQTSSSSGGDGLNMTNSKIESLASYLSGRLNVVVLDETNLTGKYDLKLPWYNENQEKNIESLKKLGLELVDETKKIDVLVISDK